MMQINDQDSLMAILDFCISVMKYLNLSGIKIKIDIAGGYS